jgi:glucose-1-phosphate thymidylyltransferase
MRGVRRMKGLILAGGRGRRLWPMTLATNKHLLPVYDRPMIYFPLSLLLRSGIRDIAIVTNPEDISAFTAVLGYGHRWGARLHYVEQGAPRGIADALRCATSFVGREKVCVTLGDNLFLGGSVAEQVRNVAPSQVAQIFTAIVAQPTGFGVLRFDEDGRPLEIVEKPQFPPSDHVVTGLYVYSAAVLSKINELSLSDRGELEITALNNACLEEGLLGVERIGGKTRWLDAGTPARLLESSTLVEELQSRGIFGGSPERAAWLSGFMDGRRLAHAASEHGSSDYGRHLASLAAGGC